MSLTEARPSTDPRTQAEWLGKQQAVEFFQNRGIDTFTVETLKNYAYNTDLLPRPKVIGRHAYWRVSDLEGLLERL